MPDVDRELLGQVAVLGEVAPPVLEALLEDGFVQVLAKDTVLFRQGEPARFLHIILDGRIGLTARSGEGQETVVEFFKAGDLFVAPAVVLELPHLMAARVIDEARILFVRADRFRALMEEDHGLALAVARELARHWRLLVRQIKDLKLRSAPQRVGSYLLGLAGEHTGGASLRLPEERRMLAQRLAMTPESLSRAFARLREVGVGGRGRSVEIEDLDALRNFCSYDDLA